MYVNLPSAFCRARVGGMNRVRIFITDFRENLPIVRYISGRTRFVCELSSALSEMCRFIDIERNAEQAKDIQRKSNHGF